MSGPIHTCALLGRFEENSVRETAAALLPHLHARGLVTLIQHSPAGQQFADLATAVDDTELVSRAQLAIVIGGDGSLLYAARLVAASGIPMLGINRGRLGFLTDVMPQDMLQCVDAALENRCLPDHRPLLDAHVIAADGSERSQLALNDVVLAKWETGRILDFETRVDGRYVNTHGGDGLVVASATGSTAYALSCGGPIVDPNLDVLVVVPICPHTLADRPIMVSGRSLISVILHERHDTRAQVTCDGVVFGELHPTDLLEIRPSTHRITLLHPPGYDYFRLLRSKLHWVAAAPSTNARDVAHMLTHLQIRDLAIIDSLELDFASGLTVLTGETGAGKSIVVDALTLICGARAAADQIRAGADKAEIAATFDIRQLPRTLRALLEEQSIEADEELLVRRIINADGRSRAYLNGQAVPVQQLREIVGSLLDVHGQHEFQSLVRPGSQRELLDRYGKLESLTDQVEAAHRVWLALLNRLLEIESSLRDRDARIELLRFQENELAAMDLKPGETAELAAEAARLGNRGRLMEGTQLAAQLLYEGEGDTAQAALARAQSALRPLLAVDPALESVMPLLDEAAIRITEAARELGRYAESLDMDSARQAVVEKRLAAAEELARKHRVAVADLPTHRIALRAELETLESAEQDVATLRRQQAEALAAYRELAVRLSESRVATAVTFSKEITARMHTLGMAGGRFQVDVAPHASTEPQPHGLDQIEFRVTANPGQPLRALAKVASGGELARLSLAVQVACVADERRCMVFDEVDAGIGGAVAEVVGRQLRALGARNQVLCVTHLPQVAAQGHHHLRVLKLTDGKTTRTALAELLGNERVREVARMLGGTQITEKGLAHAREMLSAPEAASGDTAKIKRGARSSQG